MPHEPVSIADPGDALAHAVQAFRRVMHADPSVEEWPLAIATVGRLVRRQAARCAPVETMDLLVCAVAAFEVAAREGDQATFDAAARLMQLAATRMADGS